MRVLVLGSGSKDHAWAWWIAKSHFLEGIYVAPGNYGTSQFAENLDIDPSDFDQVYKACQKHKIDYVFCGTEAPLFTQIVDKLDGKGIKTIGAPSRALKLEGDRDCARAFTDRHNIPTPSHKLIDNEGDLEAFLKRHDGQQLVVKSNKQAPSRLMVDSSDYDELLSFGKQLLQHGPVLIEDHLSGLSLSIMVLTDMKGGLILPFASDYTKTAHGEGIPTGGMGSVCPVPLNDDVKEELMERIIEPTLYGMRVEKLAYRGILTFSIILSEEGPVLVDYHVHSNDPATQAMLPQIKTDALDVFEAMQNDELDSFPLETTSTSSVAIVVASKGYPLAPETGKVLEAMPGYLEQNLFKDRPLVFFGAVAEKDGKAVTAGGRCVTVVGTGANITQANKQAYSVIDQIRFEGSWYRQDIGNRFFEN